MKASEKNLTASQMGKRSVKKRMSNLSKEERVEYMKQVRARKSPKLIKIENSDGNIAT